LSIKRIILVKKAILDSRLPFPGLLWRLTVKKRFQQALALAICALLIQLAGCATTSEQVQAHPSETGSFVVSQPLSVVIVNFVNKANNDGDNDIIAKFVPGKFGVVEDVTQPIRSICYTVDFKSAGGSTHVTYYLAGGIVDIGRRHFRTAMIDYANGQLPPFW
jgi:hypothetical protein